MQNQPNAPQYMRSRGIPARPRPAASYTPQYVSQAFADRLGMVAIDLDQLRESLPKVAPNTQILTYTTWFDQVRGTWNLRYFLDDERAEYGECTVFENEDQALATLQVVRPAKPYCTLRMRIYRAWMLELVERAKLARMPVQPKLW